MAREGKQVGGHPRQVPVTIPRSEFIDRWCDHIQPRQLTKTRYFGGWSNQNREGYLKACRRLLGIEDPPPAPAPEEPSQLFHCPKCDKPTMKHLCEIPKPSWRELFSGRDDRCPAWYVGLPPASIHPHLANEHCIDHPGSSSETSLESAMVQSAATLVATLPPAPSQPAKRQLYLLSIHDSPHASTANVLESG
jgi:Putative transposase